MEWVGPDGGRDLLFDEPGVEVLGRKTRRWVVSCKDFSTSGASVGVADLPSVTDVVAQHGAQGLLLVCTTYPSSAAVERLRAVEESRGANLATHVWDGVTLERLLSEPRTWAVGQRFMPESSGAAGWQIFGTAAPNRWVAVHRGQYFHLAKRIGGRSDFDFRALDRRFDEIASLEKSAMRLRVRGIWLDDKGGNFVWYVDCLVDGAELVQASTVEAHLQSGMSREDGLTHSFEVEVRRIRTDSDHFDVDHYDYYSRLPAFV